MQDISIQHNIGHAKHVVSFWAGKYHKDGSKLMEIRIFSNIKKMNKFIKGL